MIEKEPLAEVLDRLTRKTGPVKLCKCGRFMSIDRKGKILPHKYLVSDKWCVLATNQEEMVLITFNGIKYHKFESLSSRYGSYRRTSCGIDTRVHNHYVFEIDRVENWSKQYEPCLKCFQVDG